MEASALSHNFDLSGVEIFELVAGEQDLLPDNQYTMYQPAELELSETTKAIIDKIEDLRPSRVIIDSLSEIKLLAESQFRYRRQVLALKQFFLGRNCTALFLDDQTAVLGHDDKQLESIAHGVISLEQLSPQYGAERRRIRITKLRGQKYRGGYHDFNIQTGGLQIHPRLIASEYTQKYENIILQSGIPEIDQMLGGGLEFGSSPAFDWSRRIWQNIGCYAICFGCGTTR